VRAQALSATRVRLEAAAPAAVIAGPEPIDPALVLALGIGLGLMIASALPQAVLGGPTSRWVERGQLAVGATGLVCALGAFGVLLAAA
jgi:hypothetical protein